MASGCDGINKHLSADESSSVIKGGLENSCIMTGGESVKMLFECPICMEILVPPIYQCSRGHIICNTCQPKLTKCPSCEVPVGIIRNLALESILENVLFNCNHYPKGCKKFSKIQNLEEHHEECEFRPLECHLSHMDNCNGALLYLADTLGHLQDTHKLPTIKSEDGHSNVFRSENSISFADSDGAYFIKGTRGEDTSDYMWKGELFHFDDNDFVSLMRSEGLVNYFTFYRIGLTDTSKYSVKISAQETTAENTIFKNEVTTQFTSILDFQEEWEDWKLPDEAILHDKVLHRDRSIPKEVTVEAEPKWGVTYTISRI